MAGGLCTWQVVYVHGKGSMYNMAGVYVQHGSDYMYNRAWSLCNMAESINNIVGSLCTTWQGVYIQHGRESTYNMAGGLYTTWQGICDMGETMYNMAGSICKTGKGSLYTT